MIVLNVGGGGNRQLPVAYDGWAQHVLDIDPDVKPDVVLDARDMTTLDRGVYGAVFCSHALEHFYRHEVRTVLKGFLHVLKPGGWADIRVPDVESLLEAACGKELDEAWYECPAGPISFHDVLYGWGAMMSAGKLNYAHKCGFTAKSIASEIVHAGFKRAFVMRDGYNIRAYGFTSDDIEPILHKLGLT